MVTAKGGTAAFWSWRVSSSFVLLDQVRILQMQISSIWSTYRIVPSIMNTKLFWTTRGIIETWYLKDMLKTRCNTSLLFFLILSAIFTVVLKKLCYRFDKTPIFLFSAFIDIVTSHSSFKQIMPILSRYRSVAEPKWVCLMEALFWRITWCWESVRALLTRVHISKNATHCALRSLFFT